MRMKQIALLIFYVIFFILFFTVPAARTIAALTALPVFVYSKVKGIPLLSFKIKKH